MRGRIIAVLAAAAAVLGCTPSPQSGDKGPESRDEGPQSRDENWGRCTSRSPDVGIEGCTAVIQSGQRRSENLALAYSRRATAYARKGDYDRAIPDFDQAIKLNPNDPLAFYGRGDTFGH